MFQLIISILAIILAVALAGVSIYYGGSAFSNGSEKAQYATLTNQGSQIEAAMTLYRAQEGSVGTLATIVSGNYLKQVPVSNATTTDWTVSASSDYVYAVGIGEAVCDAGSAAAVSLTLDTDVETTLSGAASATPSVDLGVSGCVEVDDAGTVSRVFYYAL